MNTIFSIFMVSYFAVMLASGPISSSLLTSSTDGPSLYNYFNRHIAFATAEGGGGDDGGGSEEEGDTSGGGEKEIANEDNGNPVADESGESGNPVAELGDLGNPLVGLVEGSGENLGATTPTQQCDPSSAADCIVPLNTNT